MKNIIENDNKYRIGETVYAKATPDVPLMVRRYARRIYYCTITKKPEEKDVVLFEREILNDTKRT